MRLSGTATGNLCPLLHVFIAHSWHPAPGPRSAPAPGRGARGPLRAGAGHGSLLGGTSILRVGGPRHVRGIAQAFSTRTRTRTQTQTRNPSPLHFQFFTVWARGSGLMMPLGLPVYWSPRLTVTARVTRLQGRSEVASACRNTGCRHCRVALRRRDETKCVRPCSCVWGHRSCNCMAPVVWSETQTQKEASEKQSRCDQVSRGRTENKS